MYITCRFLLPDLLAVSLIKHGSSVMYTAPVHNFFLLENLPDGKNGIIQTFYPVFIKLLDVIDHTTSQISDCR